MASSPSVRSTLIPAACVAGLVGLYKCNPAETAVTPRPVPVMTKRVEPPFVGIEQSGNNKQINALMSVFFSKTASDQIVDDLLPEQLPSDFNPSDLVKACVEKQGGLCFSNGGPSVRACLSIDNPEGSFVWITDFTPSWRNMHGENPKNGVTYFTEMPSHFFVYTRDHYDEKDIHPLQSSREELVASLASSCDLVVGMIQRDPRVDLPAACDNMEPADCENHINALQEDAQEHRENMSIALASQKEFSELDGFEYVDPYHFKIDGVDFNWALAEDGGNSTWTYFDDEGKPVRIYFPEDYE